MNDRKTVFSHDRRYRFTLWREWGDRYLKNFCPPDPHHLHLPGRQDEFVQFIGLNPSTADETTDDPTIRRCIQFAKDWGFGALCMTNIFAFRATDPYAMLQAKDPIGQDNNAWLTAIASQADMIVCAWGAWGTHLNRGNAVLKLLAGTTAASKIYCLGKTRGGHPKHPLYLSKTSQPIKLPKYQP